MVVQKNAAQMQLLAVDKFAFDEMNLVEIPFCILEKSSSRAGNVVPLSNSGTEYLEASSKRGLPTALAMRAVLALLWLIKDRNNFQNRVVSVSVRELVEEYMYPGRFTNYRAPGDLLKSVEDQLHRVAATRLRTNRWYNKKLKQHTEMDASIIDYIETRQKGGRNSRRVLEIALGSKVFESVQANYTKRFDIVTWMKISHPLDQALFRWLDRQLHGDKKKHRVASIQKFGQFKMMMRSKKVERGGRTASSYILTKLSDSLLRLSGLGFSVRMTVDKSRADYSLSFERLEDKHVVNEVIETDPVDALVRLFKELFHNMPKDQRQGRRRASDYATAREWINSYGVDASEDMLRECLNLHRLSKNASEPVYTFKGLEIYESLAESATLKKTKRHAGQLELLAQDWAEEVWDLYCQYAAEDYEELHGAEAVKMNSIQAREQLLEEGTAIEFMTEFAVEARAKQLMLERLGAVPYDRFVQTRSMDALRELILKHHSESFWLRVENRLSVEDVA